MEEREDKSLLASLVTFFTVLAIAALVTFITHPEIFHFKK